VATLKPDRSTPDLAGIPRSAFWLGAAGVLPFAACAVQILAAWPLSPRLIGPALYALTLYGAVILSFMGGVQWGMAVAQTPSDADARRFSISVLPAFAAWAGLWLGELRGFLLLLAGFVALLVYDLWTVRQGEAPQWYARLRIGLTAAVVACLGLVATFGPI
jgi:Protein of unknown function (DUF3429)